MIDPKQYGSAAAELEAEAERHLMFAQKCRTAAAALRELAGVSVGKEPGKNTERTRSKLATNPKTPSSRICACGCGKSLSEYSGPGTRFLAGHAAAAKKRGKADTTTNGASCACGCGMTPRPGYRYFWGHQTRGAQPPAPAPGKAAQEERGVELAAKVVAPAAEPSQPLRAHDRFRCPKHSSECRTPNLCKSKYTTAAG